MSIEWTDRVWNPVTGCSKVSPGCTNCYAETIAKRFWRGRKFTDVRTHDDRLMQPLGWRKPSRVFVNSMSDLFHEDVPHEFIDEVFAVMGLCEERGREHVFQVLTKRGERMRDYMRTRGHHAWNSRRIGTEAYPPRNVWLGVSVEDRGRLYRIEHLEQTPAAVRFLSLEPLLEDLDCIGEYLQGIHWVIIGGESGAGARGCNVAWVRSIVQQCKAVGVAAFVKQLGSVPMMDEAEWRALPKPGILKASNHCRVPGGMVPVALVDPKGGNPAEWTPDLRVREFPA